MSCQKYSSSLNTLYQIGIFFLWLGIQIASPFHPKAKKWVSGRKGWENNLEKKLTGTSKNIWFHCASKGEFEDGREVLEAIAKKYPDYTIILTFFSPSGYENTRNYKFAKHIFYLPIDFKRNCKAFLNLVEPEMVFFCRSDIWINYIDEVFKRKIPSFFISFNMSETSKYHRSPYSKLYKPVLQKFSAIFCMNERTHILLTSKLQLSNSIIAGSTRTDRVYKVASFARHFEKIKKFCEGSYCVFAGSTLPKDDQIILRTIDSIGEKKVKWVIAPHEINQKRLESICAESKGKMILYSNIDKISDSHRVLWIDCIGILAEIYRYGSMAIIGGGFNKIGIHNILEPASFGLPVCFGPNHRNYIEALEMLDEGLARIFNDSTELEEIILQNLNKQSSTDLRNSVKAYVTRNINATQKIMDHLEEQGWLVSQKP